MQLEKQFGKRILTQFEATQLVGDYNGNLALFNREFKEELREGMVDIRDIQEFLGV